MIKKGFFNILCMFILSHVAFAAHPLITDDTGTQGKGRLQIEVNAEYAKDKETADGVTVKETGTEAALTFSWGVTEETDFVIGIPRQSFILKEDGAQVASESGVSDLSLELKYRFYEKNGLSLAVKPGVSMPTGDEEIGLGTGKVCYGIMFITTKEAGSWTIHGNAGYNINEFKLQADRDANRRGIWHVSAAAEYEVVKDLKAVANLGIEQKSEKGTGTDPAFLIGGLIYALSENFDVDAGIKLGLNRAETDTTVLAGIAMRF